MDTAKLDDASVRVEALSGGGEDGRGLLRGWKKLCRGAVILLSYDVNETIVVGGGSRTGGTMVVVVVAGPGVLGSAEKVIDVAVEVDGACWW